MFFFDAGPMEQKQQALVGVPQADEEQDEEEKGRDPPAWEDSDDERIMVSLGSVPRLRKLRITEAEDVISGKEYAKRLRRQYVHAVIYICGGNTDRSRFERLYPVPEWADAATASKKKRRRGSEAAGSSEEESSEDDMDVDDDVAAQPLAKLLRDAESLTKATANRPNKRRKLRPEVLDIQRTKDISGTSPVRFHAASSISTLG